MGSSQVKTDKDEKASFIAQLRDDLLDGKGYEMFRQPLPGANKSGEALQVPGYFQTGTFTCGYIAGMNVVHTFHPDYPKGKFRQKLRMKSNTGADIWPLVRALRSSGIGVSVRRTMAFEEITTAISDGYPVILLIKTDEDNVSHWVVVYGYQREPEAVLLAGKGIGILKQNIIPRETFENIWYTEENLASLVCWGKPLKNEPPVRSK